MIDLARRPKGPTPDQLAAHHLLVAAVIKRLINKGVRLNERLRHVHRQQDRGRKYIDCEIEKTASRRNGMLGVITHTLDVLNGRPAAPARSLAQRFAYLPTGTSAAALARAEAVWSSISATTTPDAEGWTIVAWHWTDRSAVAGRLASAGGGAKPLPAAGARRLCFDWLESLP